MVAEPGGVGQHDAQDRVHRLQLAQEVPHHPPDGTQGQDFILLSLRQTLLSGFFFFPFFLSHLLEVLQQPPGVRPRLHQLRGAQLVLLEDRRADAKRPSREKVLPDVAISRYFFRKK